MNRNELISMLATRLAAKTQLTPAQFFQALTDAPVATRQQLVASVNKREPKILAEQLLKIGDAKRLELATTTVTAIFADDTVTTAELLSLL